MFSGLILLSGWTAFGQGRFDDTTNKAFEEGERQEAEAVAAQEKEGLNERTRPLYEKALASYHEAIKITPRFTKAYAKAGYILYLLERSGEAISLLKKAMEVDPADFDVKHILGINYYKEKDFDKAIPLLREAADKSPEQYSVACFFLGKHYYGLNNLKEAEIYFQKYLISKPDDHKVHGVVGNIYMKQQRYENALKEFKKVLDLNPNDLAAQINVGNIEYQKGNYRESANQFEKVLAQDPKKASIHYNLASSYIQLRMYKEAIAFFRSFLRLKPQSHPGQFYLGHALAAVGELEEALAAYRMARQLKPNDGETSYRMGLVLARLGRLDEARQELKLAVTQNPDDPWPKAQLGNVDRRQGNLEAALAVHRQLARKHSDNVYFQIYCAESLMQNGELEEAANHLTAAVRLQPRLPQIREAQVALLLRLARQLMLEEKLAEARIKLAEARKLAPEDPQVAFGLALLQVRQGQVEAGHNELSRVDQQLGATMPGVILGRAEALALLGRHDEAQQQILRLSSTPPQPGANPANQAAAASGESRLAHTRALILALSGKIDEAIGMLEQLSGIPGDIVLRNLTRLSAQRAASLMAEGKAKQARALIQQAEKGVESLPAEQSARLRRLIVRTLIQQWDFGHALDLLKVLRKQLPKDEELLYFEAYAQYRRSQFERSVALLKESPATKQAGRFSELMRQSLHRQAGLLLRRGQAQPTDRLLQQILTYPGGEYDQLRHDQAVLQAISGQKGPAQAKLAQLQGRGTVPEAELNLGMLLDDRGEKEKAYRLYRNHAARGGEHAALAKQLAEAKERIFGFAQGGTP